MSGWRLNKYEEVLEYMYRTLPMFQRVGKAAYKKDLTNSLALSDHLSAPEKSFPSIHIAGTNGKGSVSHMIAAILQAHGFKTGLYISPHYKDFRERIKINGEYIEKEKVVEFISQHVEIIEKIQPSFFEIAVAMAFDYFCKEKVDIAVIETGLGGRLDSTNIINPLLSIITNISWDHKDILGNTLKKIAKEKAGIIKDFKPVIIGRKQKQTDKVFILKAAQSHSALHFAEELVDQKTYYDENGIDEIRWKFNNQEIIIHPELQGIYQTENIRCAIGAMYLLEQIHFLKLIPVKLKYALEHTRELTKIIGRFQWLSQSPKVLCDSAHNEDGLHFLFKQIGGIPYNNLHIVCGFVKDKSLDKILKLFPVHADYYFTQAKIPRALDSENLAEQAGHFGLNGKAYKSVAGALKAAKRKALANDLILITGSIFVVGEIL
ncbi:MAG: bifunctional folylpolyglutamate synthase/dihydrofolate synthase [Bacteroidota bacterium]|nr:bifunctional folylpolyglutamate synthase/dihydrofolate synthase [Bacteroidota bacterium]